MTPILWMSLGAGFACILLLWHDFRHAPTIDPPRPSRDSVPARVDEIEDQAFGLQRELNQIARMSVELEGHEWNTPAANEIERDIWDGKCRVQVINTDITREFRNRAAWIRERLDALAHELCEMRGYEWDTEEGAEYEAAIVYGIQTVAEAERRIMERFKHRNR